MVSDWTGLSSARLKASYTEWKEKESGKNKCKQLNEVKWAWSRRTSAKVIEDSGQRTH
jgi:hypothetical protein